MSTRIDFLIVGQGLAGSLLAWELMRRQCRVVIVDNGLLNASRVAAGLINPVTGLRLVKLPDADYFLSTAKQCYGRLGSYFQTTFYLEKTMLRLLCTPQERDFGRKRLVDPEYGNFLGNLITFSEIRDSKRAPLIGLEQKQTGYLQIRALLDAMKSRFIDNNAFRQVQLCYDEIVITKGLRWQDLCPAQIVFCEGYRSQENPWFSYLPLQPVKGEILTLKHHLAIPDRILNYGQWLLPVDLRTLRIGATFDHRNIDTETTVTGKSELILNASRFLPKIEKAEVISHQAGIRPATSDRQPFIGLHPQHRQLAIFNGFGARGSLLIPGYCRLFAEFLLEKKPLPTHCSIDRFGSPNDPD